MIIAQRLLFYAVLARSDINKAYQFYDVKIFA